VRKPRKGSAAAAYDSAPVPSDPVAEPAAAAADQPGQATTAPRSRRLAVNTLIFSVATGLSRIAGLVREVVASSYFGTTGAFSAFTIAFQVPNLVRSLVADAAISAAFVPVFTELLEQNKKREAFRLASNLFFLILAGLGAISALFILLAGNVMPLFTGDTFTPALDHLTAGLAQVLFPIVVLLGLNGLVVGILNSYEHFTVPAIAPLVWNVVIIVLLVVLKPAFHGDDQLYAYAIGVLIATVVQFGMALPVLRRFGFRFEFHFNPRDPRVRRVLVLMLPVTVGLGIINFDLLINSTLGSLVSEEAPRAIDAAFRIYMLPQGMFSVALATVLFPALSRYAARGDVANLGRTAANGMRQIFLLLVPAAAVTVALATPITRLVYERGSFDANSTELVSQALFWFSFSLPFSGVNLLLTRAFFSLQKPWTPTALAAGNLAVNTLVSLALYKPFGIAGLVIGTAVASFGMTLGQGMALRRRVPTLEAAATIRAFVLITLASALLGGVAWVVWSVLDDALGRGIVGQIISVGTGITVGAVVYAAIVLGLRLREAEQIRDLVLRRAGRA
jgi:putative peptidoglycan lipid II flippase